MSFWSGVGQNQFFSFGIQNHYDFLYNNFEMQNQHKSGSFIQKLYKLLQSPNFSDIITWNQSKTGIDVLDVKRMETEIIPKYFRHQKFQSFVRQLNLYGFRKIKVQGRHRFTHPLLLNGQQLSAITQFKGLKSAKKSKQTVQSPVEAQNRPQVYKNNQVLSNSMENARELQSLNQRRDTPLHENSSGIGMLPGQTIFMIPPNYFGFWNFMQSMSANMPYIQATALMPQQ